ncbi:MAG: fasciclin domain-containing protein [Bacteroidota bacterium]
MKFQTIIFSLFFALLFSTTLGAQCQGSSKAKAQLASWKGGGDDIVDIAAGNENFSTLVAAVKAAGLVETLKSAGPFTVFAPTNAAFAKLPEGTVASLLKPENKSTLTKILTYHVVAGEFKAADVVNAIKNAGGKFTVETVSGDKLTASLKGGKVILTDEKGGVVTVTQTDLDASNGVIHVIDGVVLPN